MKTKPCGPNNFEWRKIKVKKLPNETSQDYRNRQVAFYRLENPLDARKRNYKYNFGLTIEQYNKKLKEQNFVCAICEQPVPPVKLKN